MNEISNGKIWTGTQALENGLIDNIGTQSEAIERLKEIIGYEEIDVEYLRTFKWYEVKPGVHKVQRPSGDYLLLLGEGRLVNLSLATGHPSRVMDGSFCNQVLAQILLFKEGFANKKQAEKKLFVKVLPKKLDEEVAALMVRGFGGTITKCNRENGCTADIALLCNRNQGGNHF